MFCFVFLPAVFFLNFDELIFGLVVERITEELTDGSWLNFLSVHHTVDENLVDESQRSNTLKAHTFFTHRSRKNWHRKVNNLYTGNKTTSFQMPFVPRSRYQEWKTCFWIIVKVPHERHVCIEFIQLCSLCFSSFFLSKVFGCLRKIVRFIPG